MTTIEASRPATAPSRSPLRTAAARLIFEQAVARVPVRVTYSDGRTPAGGGMADPGAPELHVVRPASLFRRLGLDPNAGPGEAYTAGDWRAGDETDLADLLTPFAQRLTTLLPPALRRLRSLVDRRPPRQQDNTPSGARAHISAHYDLGNELFAAFLDPTMTYSCALFDETAAIDGAGDLEAAQLRKVDAVLDLARVQAGSRVLEIGTGWGTLAIRAAERGAHVTTITLSNAQYLLAAERIRESGLPDLVDLRLQDYREVRGEFDSIVSVEMLEAVGRRYWPVFFAALDRLLAPGATAAVQTITMAHEHMWATRNSYGWINKHIFPGGLIPSLPAIDAALAPTTLRVAGRRELRPHYARTLRMWRERFLASWPRLHEHGFDETFRRTWEFYLAYCEAGFRSGHLGVSQLLIAREDR